MRVRVRMQKGVSALIHHLSNSFQLNGLIATGLLQETRNRRMGGTLHIAQVYFIAPKDHSASVRPETGGRGERRASPRQRPKKERGDKKICIKREGNGGSDHAEPAALPH